MSAKNHGEVEQIFVPARTGPTLVPIGLVVGVTMLFAFRRWTDRDALRRATNRIIAHILELRLFIDEPVLALRAQRELVRYNARMLALIAPPTAIGAVVFFFPITWFFAVSSVAAFAAYAIERLLGYRWNLRDHCRESASEASHHGIGISQLLQGY